MLRTTVVGASGRMGQAIITEVLAHASFALAGASEHEKSPCIGKNVGSFADSGDIGVIVTDNVVDALESAQVVIDFTSPEGTLTHAAMAARRKVPMVIGTTGFTDEQLAQLQRAAEKIPVVYSPNMSVGVNLFWYASEQMAKVCGSTYTLAIEETHHVHKKDAPSGTAKRLHTLAAHAADRKLDNIHVTSHREGEVIGDHAITFESAGDTITIAHHAKERAIFAKGSLVAAAWVVDKPAGWYGMYDVLGIT